MSKFDDVPASVKRSRAYAQYTGNASFEAAVSILAKVVEGGPSSLTESEYELWREDSCRMHFDPDFDPARIVMSWPEYEAADLPPVIALVDALDGSSVIHADQRSGVRAETTFQGVTLTPLSNREREEWLSEQPE